MASCNVDAVVVGGRGDIRTASESRVGGCERIAEDSLSMRERRLSVLQARLQEARLLQAFDRDAFDGLNRSTRVRADST